MGKKKFEKATDQTEVAKSVPKQYYWFAFVLYPREDIWHARALEYIRNNPMLYSKWCAIEHTRDLEDEVSDTVCDSTELCNIFFDGHKKAHTHVLVRCKSKMTVAGFLKRWEIADFSKDENRWIDLKVIKHIEPVHDYTAYVQYMAHIDFHSLFNRSKSKYFPEEFIGSPDLISECLNKTTILSNWQLLASGFNSVAEKGFSSFCSEMASLPPSEAEQMWNIFSRCQGIFLRADQCHRYEIEKAKLNEGVLFE